MAILQAKLDMVPADAVAFFRAKGEVISWDWTDVQREENVHAFTVAKATSLDVLRTIRSEVDRAIGDGQTFAEFKRTLKPRLADMGWWGQQDVVDSNTGDLKTVQLGSDRRLRTIFQTNVQTSYMAGRYKRLLANVADRPYWKYVAVMDSRTRPAHAALNGRVFRWDDPIWSIIFPPNGWGCRCRVTAMNQAEVDAAGITVESGADRIAEREVSLGRDKPTVTVRGIRYKDQFGKDRVFWPDPLWDYNPGAAWARFDPAGFDADRPGPRTLKPTLNVQPAAKSWNERGRPPLSAPTVPHLPTPADVVVPASVDAAASSMNSVMVPNGRMQIVQTPLDQVVLRPELLPQVATGANAATMADAPFALATLQQPFEIWLTPYADGSYRRRYLAIFRGEQQRLAYVRENRDGSLFWQVYNTTDATLDAFNDYRRGTLLYSAPNATTAP